MTEDVATSCKSQLLTEFFKEKWGLSVEGLLQLDDVLLSWGLVVPF